MERNLQALESERIKVLFVFLLIVMNEPLLRYFEKAEHSKNARKNSAEGAWGLVPQVSVDAFSKRR